MEWKKNTPPFDAGGIKVNEDEDETEVHDEEYSPWQTTSPDGLGKKIFQRPDLPLKTIGIGLLVVIAVIMLLVFATRSDDDLYKNKITGLENRIQLLENQLTDMGQALSKNNATADQAEDLATRLDRFETSIHSRMGQITNQLSTLKKKVGTKKTVNSIKNKTLKKTVKTPSPAPSHKVQSGDTLYDIARRYGVTVKQLKQWNKLRSGGNIYPGQKLKVGP
jgi:LysM repeat protein